MTSTESTKVHEALIQSVEQLNCGVVGRDPDYKIVFANERFLDWLGYTRDELVGEPVEVLFPPEILELLHEEQDLIRTGDVRARIGVLRRKDSTTFPVLVIPQRFTGPPEKGRIYFSVFVDLGTVQTAKAVGYGAGINLRDRLDRIALELQSLGLVSSLVDASPVSFEHPSLAGLSERQKEVLVQLVNGERVTGIAKRLHISPHTVRNHLKAMYRELDVRNQAELIAHVRALR